MVGEFNSIEELYERVLPALRVRIRDGNKTCNVKEKDIWDYLVENKWKKSMNLMFSDIVDDILSIELDVVEKYLNQKLNMEEEE